MKMPILVGHRSILPHIQRNVEETRPLSPRLGKDKLGNEALERVRKLGLDTSFIQHDAIKPTGTVPVTLINGQPEYFITPEVAFDYIAYDAVSQKIDDTKFDVLYFGNAYSTWSVRRNASTAP